MEKRQKKIDHRNGDIEDDNVVKLILSFFIFFPESEILQKKKNNG